MTDPPSQHRQETERLIDAADAAEQPDIIDPETEHDGLCANCRCVSVGLYCAGCRQAFRDRAGDYGWFR